VYDDFNDPRYDAAGQARSLSNEYEYGAIVQGVDFDRFQQKTNSLLLKGSITSQMDRSNQVKAGGELMFSKLEFGTDGTLTYRNINGRDSLVRITSQPPDFPGVQEYNPVSGAAYVHDLLEWYDLTIRAGLRFEYFDANSTVPSDLKNPADTIQGAPPSYPVPTTVKTSWAPRLGVSYPVTARSSIFFSYGHFYQFPPLKDIFGNSNYDVLARIQAGSEEYGVLGNPDIKPEKTVQYEFGYKHAVTDLLGVSVNVFYKDIRDLLGVEFITTYNNASYARLTNIDFGSVMGVTLSLDQRRIGIFSAMLDYTWQNATGNSSDPRESAQLKEAGLDARPRQVPLNWDQLHTLNFTMQLSEPRNWSVSSIMRYGSGQPYTPAIGSGFGSQIETNSGRKPNGLLVDLRADKTFELGGVGMNVFLRVFNLFDARFFNGMVFSTTGSPDYSLQPATDRNTLADPTRYYEPRRVELGIALSSSF
jgi:outer membrane receptor protein involved in Fe transport